MRIAAATATILCLLPAVAAAQDRATTSAARSLLTQAQGPSFQSNREYCGYIGTDAAGRIVATPPRRGGRDGCRPRDSSGLVELLASYHTHGRFDLDADAEVPSLDDLYADTDEGIDGYVATPGGRFWFVDIDRGEVRQICGLGCLPSDPRFQPGAFGQISNRYSEGQLIRREEEG
ncbi:DUF4329 domain-containing protein [uncultured Jannaschia sp.]|uniref:DUF4329 domain-containing protein n=1 Tax=uncultured Jannaschia sp. TaxID=293347 RepID=UPI00260BDF03|nr:DUF4329 domain-containing protein [uncultured Jannaschia sp.]